MKKNRSQDRKQPGRPSQHHTGAAEAARVLPPAAQLETEPEERADIPPDWWRDEYAPIEIKHKDTGRVWLRVYLLTLWEAQLPGADLKEADLAREGLGHANLEASNLTRARLTGARMKKASLRGAKLVEADLEDACLIEADMEGADLTGARLRGANLLNANLRGADLTGALLSDEHDEHWQEGTLTQLTGARYDCSTRWPEGFDPVKQGAWLIE